MNSNRSITPFGQETGLTDQALAIKAGIAFMNEQNPDEKMLLDEIYTPLRDQPELLGEVVLGVGNFGPEQSYSFSILKQFVVGRALTKKAPFIPITQENQTHARSSRNYRA